MFNSAQNHLVNPELLFAASSAWLSGGQEKRAFVPAGGPGMGGDPSGGMQPPGGGQPPADPSMAGGAPPAGGVGNPGGGLDAGSLRQILTEVLAQQQAGGGAGGPGNPSGAAIKPKIDVNVELMQIKNMLAKLLDAMGVPIPAQDMVATPDKLQGMAQGQSTLSGAQAGGQGQPQGASAIQPPAPVSPMQGAFPADPGAGKTAHDRFASNVNKADSLLRQLAVRRSHQ